MQIHQPKLVRTVALAGAAFMVSAADETSLGPTVGNVLITKYIPGGNLGLSNKAPVKTVEALDLRVSGEEPVYEVTGQLFCKNGARLVEAQAVIGNVLLHGDDTMAYLNYGESPKLTSIAGRSDADVSILVRLSVVRKDDDPAIEMRFNPAGAFLKKVESFSANGGSAASYLRQDQAFDMPVKVNLIAWCKMPASSSSVLAGKTYAGIATRSIPVTILYSGDAGIVDGRGVRAAAGQQVKAKEETPPLRRKVAPPPPPPRRTD